MKPKYLLLLLLLSAYTVSAQLTINPGAEFSVTGNTALTLHNTDLINNGSFSAANSMVRFSGNASSSISGSQPVQFFEMEMNKTNDAAVTLQRPISITQRILFSSGFLNLNGFNTDLGTTGLLDGEKENSRITGTNGGLVLFSALLNAPAGLNPGNLGAVISSNQNLGNVIIRRGHQSQTNNSVLSKSILRFYDITPANNTNLNATLRINYFTGELNGLLESSLAVFKSDDAVNWSGLGFTAKDGTIHFVEKAGINSFARFTLSNIDNPLPVRFVSFTGKCINNGVELNWITAQEQNSDHFDIERSADGIIWRAIGSVHAAGNSITERSYFFTDNSGSQNANYRIAEYDQNRSIQYTKVIRSSCALADMLSVTPNPFHGDMFINITGNNESQAVIKITDSKGMLVKMQKATIVQGSNRIRIDMSAAAKGVYSVQAIWNNGQMKKAVQVIKQ